MKEEEIDNFLRSLLFSQDKDPSALDNWTFARYTKVDRKGRVFNVYLHKDADGSVVVNLERVQTDHEKIEGATAHVTIDKLVEGISDIQSLEKLLEALNRSS